MAPAPGTEKALHMLELMDALDDLVHRSPPVLMTKRVWVDKYKVYELLDEMRASLPDELRLARLIVEEDPGAVERARAKLPPASG